MRGGVLRHSVRLRKENKGNERNFQLLVHNLLTSAVRWSVAYFSTTSQHNGGDISDVGCSTRRITGVATEAFRVQPFNLKGRP